jgi:hypothetical protein
MSDPLKAVSRANVTTLAPLKFPTLNRTKCYFLSVRYLCGAVLVVGLALGLNAAAQSELTTVKPKPQIQLKPDLWIPSGIYCKFILSPAYDPKDGILYVEVGNKGTASAPSSSLRVKESLGEEGEMGGPWTFHRYYWATVPALAAGQQVVIQLQVQKYTNGFNSNGKPIKHPRQWIFKADGKDQVDELNEGNNGHVYVTYN